MLDLQHVVASSGWLDTPFDVAMHGIGFYVGLSASLALVSEWERKTIVPLLVAPLDSTVVVTWKLATAFLMGLGLTAAMAAYLVLVSVASSIPGATRILWDAAASLPFLAAATTYGLLLGTFTWRARTAALAYVGITAILVAIRLLWNVFLEIPHESLSAPLIWALNLLRVLAPAERIVSPFTYRQAVHDALDARDGLALARGLSAAVVYAAMLAVVAARRCAVRGVPR